MALMFQETSVTIAQVPIGRKKHSAHRVATFDFPAPLSADNADPGILHNWALYTDESASEQLAATEICIDCTEKVSFDPPEPGVYFFRCDVHPIQMVGTFGVA